MKIGERQTLGLMLNCGDYRHKKYKYPGFRNNESERYGNKFGNNVRNQYCKIQGQCNYCDKMGHKADNC